MCVLTRESDYAPDTLRPSLCGRLQRRRCFLEPEGLRKSVAMRLREPRLPPPAPAAPSSGAPPPCAPSSAASACSCSSSSSSPSPLPCEGPAPPRSARSSAWAASSARYGPITMRAAPQLCASELQGHPSNASISATCLGERFLGALRRKLAGFAEYSVSPCLCSCVWCVCLCVSGCVKCVEARV
jgi:hypothetical protein